MCVKEAGKQKPELPGLSHVTPQAATLGAGDRLHAVWLLRDWNPAGVVWKC